MASKQWFTVLDNAGAPDTTASVELFVSGGSKVGDLTHDANGRYYYVLSESGDYDLKVNGVTWYSDIHLSADDVINDITDKMDKVSGGTQNNLVSLDASGNAEDSGVAKTDVLDADHQQADGDGSTASLSANKEHFAKAIELVDSAGNFTTDDVESALSQIKTELGDVDFSSADWLSGVSDVTNAILTLVSVMQNLQYQNAGGGGGVGYRYYLLQYRLSGLQDAPTYFENVGYAMPRSGFVSKVTMTWASANISSAVTVKINSAIIGTINSSEVADGVKVFTNFISSSISFSAGEKMRPKDRKSVV